MIAQVASTVARWFLAGVLVLAALVSPFLGFGASEYYEGRKLAGVVESDWLMALGLVAGGACVGAAVRLVRRLPGK